MKKLLLTPLMLLTLSVNASELVELNNKLERTFSKHSQEMSEKIRIASTNPKHYFLPYERIEIIKSHNAFLKELKELEKFEPDEAHRLRLRKGYKKRFQKVLSKVIKYKMLAKYLNLSFSGKNPYMAVLAETDKELNYKSKHFRKRVRKTLTQARTRNRSHNTGTEERLENMPYFHLYDLSERFDEFLKVEKRHNGLTDEEVRLLASSVDDYFENMSELKEKISNVNWKAGRYTPFYALKVLLLKGASYLALPGKHKISLETLKTIDPELEPGDIGLIQRYRKLSNLVFKGKWTHSLLYLGRYEKLVRYFDDMDTNMTFASKCFKESLSCTDFISYLEAVHPTYMKTYKASNDDKDPIVTIEALKPGVIMLTMKKSMGWDNLALMRPKLSKKDKALAIAEAFRNLGKPYDYNFNGQTNERLVCTEVVSYSYSPDPRINKGGLTWEMNYVLGKPIMYAFDVIETYFKRLGTNKQQLELAIYVKGIKGKNGEFKTARRGTEEELKATLDLED